MLYDEFWTVVDAARPLVEVKKWRRRRRRRRRRRSSIDRSINLSSDLLSLPSFSPLPPPQASTDNALNFDVLAWHVDARKGQAGFSPHRDRQPDNARESFRPAEKQGRDAAGEEEAGTPR